MLNKEYPLHDMNVVFDMIENSIAKGGTHDKTLEEMNLLMHLYAGLPAEAVEEGMKFIHGRACQGYCRPELTVRHLSSLLISWTGTHGRSWWNPFPSYVRRAVN